MKIQAISMLGRGDLVDDHDMSPACRDTELKRESTSLLACKRRLTIAACELENLRR
jgi:hypothetical protein